MLLREEIPWRYEQERLTARDDIGFLKRTDLGSQYPKERFEERIEKPVRNTSISLIARNEAGRAVGVLFGLTDLCCRLCVTDLGVDRDHEGQGIGMALMKRAHETSWSTTGSNGQSLPSNE